MIPRKYEASCCFQNEDVLKCILVDENVGIPIQISLTFVSEGLSQHWLKNWVRLKQVAVNCLDQW